MEMTYPSPFFDSHMLVLPDLPSNDLIVFTYFQIGNYHSKMIRCFYEGKPAKFYLLLF